jgi:polysaccharide biosynthesis protein PslG
VVRPWLRLALVVFTTVSLAGRAEPTPTAQAGVLDDDFVYGVIVDTTDARSMRLASDAGFTHAKMILHWAAVEPSPGNYAWNGTKENDFDNIMKPARNEQLQLVVRVDGVPGWAGGSPANANLDAVRRFYENAARYGAGTVVAYEILNEPNLPFEWGGAPNGKAYAQFLKAAYKGVKAGDPDALVIGGGPSPNTGGNGGTVEDTDFLNQMFDGGAKDYLDILGIHNYGGNAEPERDPGDCGICFRRAELYRDLMVRRGVGDIPIWMTEWGYLMDPGSNVGQYDWMKVAPKQQADYLIRALKYARTNWPWLTGSLVSNLDASTSPYHNGPGDGLPWFAMLNGDYSPRPVYRQFRDYRSDYIVARDAAREEARRQAELARQAADGSGTNPPAADNMTPPSADDTAPPAADDPAPTGDVVVASLPAGATAGDRLKVVGTDGDGVSLRAAPSTTAARLKTIPEGAILTALGELRNADGHDWLSVKDQTGAKGWVAADYVKSAPA